MGRVSQIVTGWFQRKPKKLSFMTTMFCIDCSHLWDASNVSFPCPKCASKEVIDASRWPDANLGAPTAENGKGEA